MDFGQAALLIGVVLGLSQFVKRVLPENLRDDSGVVAAIVLAVSIVAVFLVAESAWGHEQIVGGKSLDELGWSSRLLVAVLLAGGASFAWEGFISLRNIGQNQLTDTQRKAMDTSAVASARAMVRNLGPDQGGAHDTLPKVPDGVFPDTPPEHIG